MTLYAGDFAGMSRTFESGGINYPDDYPTSPPTATTFIGKSYTEFDLNMTDQTSSVKVRRFLAAAADACPTTGIASFSDDKVSSCRYGADQYKTIAM